MLNFLMPLNLLKLHAEMCFPVLPCLQGEAAVVGSKDLADKGEAKALPVGFCGKEGGKQFCGNIWQYGYPVVGNVKSR